MKKNFSCVLACDNDHHIDRFIGLCDCITRNIQIQNKVVFRKLTDCVSGSNEFNFCDEGYIHISSGSSSIQSGFYDDYLDICANNKSYRFELQPTFSNENTIFKSEQSCIFLSAKSHSSEQSTQVTILDTTTSEIFKVLSSMNDPSTYECSCLFVNPNTHTTFIQGVSDDSSCFKMLNSGSSSTFELCSTNECFLVGNGEINVASNINNVHVGQSYQQFSIDSASAYLNCFTIQFSSPAFSEYICVDFDSFMMCYTNCGHICFSGQKFEMHHAACSCVQSNFICMDSDIQTGQCSRIVVCTNKAYIGNQCHFNLGHFLIDCDGNSYTGVLSSLSRTGTYYFDYDTNNGGITCMHNCNLHIYEGLVVEG